MKAGRVTLPLDPFSLREGPVSPRGPQTERPDRADGARWGCRVAQALGQALELRAAPCPHPSLPLIWAILLI